MSVTSKHSENKSDRRRSVIYENQYGWTARYGNDKTESNREWYMKRDPEIKIVHY